VPNQEVDECITSLSVFLKDAFATLDTHNSLSISIDNQADPWLGNPDNEIFQTLEKAITDVWGPIGGGRRTSTPGPRQRPLRSSSETINPSLKPTPTTTLTLTNGSDYTSLAATSQDSPTVHEGGEVSEGRRPLYIREGGSIPSIRFLEKEFDAPAAHLPCGQASDRAHLDNERLRLNNLYKSREIFRRVFKELPKK
jgi:di- and tripeptidase